GKTRRTCPSKPSARVRLPCAPLAKSAPAGVALRGPIPRVAMSSNGSTRGPPSYIRKPRQVRSRLAPVIISAVALALMADRALAAEPQMPESFRGTWCGSDNASLRGELGLYSCPADDSEIEITATGVTAEVGNPAIPMSCVVRQVTKFDVCPWGMIYKNRERARALRSFQINP